MMRAMIRRPTNLSSAIESLARNAHREQQKLYFDKQYDNMYCLATLCQYGGRGVVERTKGGLAGASKPRRMLLVLFESSLAGFTAAPRSAAQPARQPGQSRPGRPVSRCACLLPLA
jgi:hypothetical protein